MNRDRSRHVIEFSFFANSRQAISIQPGMAEQIPISKAEKSPLPVDCNIHPWMHAYVVVLDHPFVAASDSDGNISLPGLPIDLPLRFRVFHEAGKLIM